MKDTFLDIYPGKDRIVMGITYFVCYCRKSFIRLAANRPDRGVCSRWIIYGGRPTQDLLLSLEEFCSIIIQRGLLYLRCGLVYLLFLVAEHKLETLLSTKG